MSKRIVMVFSAVANVNGIGGHIDQGAVKFHIVDTATLTDATKAARVLAGDREFEVRLLATRDAETVAREMLDAGFAADFPIVFEAA